MLERHISLKERNTFGFPVLANLYCKIENLVQLQELWANGTLRENKVLILGGGSNILFTEDYSGLVLHNQIKGREIVKQDEDSIWLKFGAGEDWHSVVLWAVENEWGGIENLSLIPGTCGAAPIQNIGAYGVEIKDTFEELETFHIPTGSRRIYSKEQCQFGYRDSIFKNAEKGQHFITSITLKLNKNPTINTQYGDIQNILEKLNILSPTIANVSNAVIAIRQSKLPDPAKLGNCGSFFKNPVVSKEVFEQINTQNSTVKSFHAGPNLVKIPAAWLIENAGWKGYRKGDAGVHEKQALVLVNYGTANGKEIKQLAFEIQSDVAKKFGVQLEMEVNIQ